MFLLLDINLLKKHVKQFMKQGRTTHVLSDMLVGSNFCLYTHFMMLGLDNK